MSYNGDNDYNSTSESEPSYSLYEDDYVQGLQYEVQQLRDALKRHESDHIEEHPEWRPRVNGASFEITRWTSVVGC